MSDVTAVLLISPLDPAEKQAFVQKHEVAGHQPNRDLTERKRAAAQAAQSFDQQADRVPGLVRVRLNTYDNPQLDWAFALTFASRADASRWEHSKSATQLRDHLALAGLRPLEQLVIIDPSAAPPSGVVFFTNRVLNHQAGPFLDFMGNELYPASADFPGYIGSTMVPSESDPNVWVTIMLFDTEEHLQDWVSSDRRAELLPQLREFLAGDFETITSRTPFGAVVRLVSGKPQISPSWKIIMLVVSVLFPTVTLLLRFLNPELDRIDLDPGVVSVIGQLIATSFVTMLWMPAMSRIFDWWIDPVRGRAVGVSILGATAVVAVYAVEIIFFAIFPALTPWGST